MHSRDHYYALRFQRMYKPRNVNLHELVKSCKRR